MKQHSRQVLRKVNEMCNTGKKLYRLMGDLRQVDTDVLCRACGAEALNLLEGTNTCEQCGHRQHRREMICLSNHLWPISGSLSDTQMYQLWNEDTNSNNAEV